MVISPCAPSVDDEWPRRIRPGDSELESINADSMCVSSKSLEPAAAGEEESSVQKWF
jgi:hypothetical protein